MTHAVTTEQSVYPPSMLEDLRAALVQHFTPSGAVPDAVDFRITEEHEHLEGLAWAGDGALLHTGDRTEPADDLTGAVGDELDDLTEFIAPRFGDTLIVALTPGYTPPLSAEDEEENAQEAPGPAFDPHSPRPFLLGLDNKVLLSIEFAVRAICHERAWKRLSEYAAEALPALREEEPFDSTSPVARVVFKASWDQENGDYWSPFADVHHVDGTVTEDVDLDDSSGQVEMALADLFPPDGDDLLIIDVPGVTAAVPQCAVCHEADCRHPDSQRFTTCAVCPRPFTATHSAHPRPGCPGFSVAPL
ncbi:hypothetical protein ACFVQ9_26055 [Streptomyces goshikiensis]|uniref:hypothetical protein n=1 Tax=Streptomyces goshikiensis TaxID=1942 RepID=UPI0036D1491B